MEHNYSNIYVVLFFLANGGHGSWVRDILIAWYGEDIANKHGLHKAAKKAMTKTASGGIWPETVFAMEVRFLESLGLLPMSAVCGNTELRMPANFRKQTPMEDKDLNAPVFE